MKQLLAFTKKEFMEMKRTGKLMILLIIFVVFGIMSPAMAKLTPWLFDMMSESMEEQGIIVSNVEVNALSSWTQYYKNIFMELVVLVVVFSGILTNELQKGTLINMITKGLARWKVMAAKTIMMVCVWSLAFWGCFGITYGYTTYLWDNSIANHLFFGSFCIYMLGILMIALIFFGSAFSSSSTGVILVTGGVVAISYILSIVPKLADYMPTKLLGTGSLTDGSLAPADFRNALIVTIVLCIVFYGVAIVRFNKKRL